MASGNGDAKCAHGVSLNEYCYLCAEGPKPETDPPPKPGKGKND